MTEENKAASRRDEILLKEYEVSQAAADASSTRVWTIAGFFLASNVIGPSVVVTLTSRSIASWGDLLASVALLLALAVGATILIRQGGAMVNRERWYLSITYARMREIEGALGLWKNRYTDQLDHWDCQDAIQERSTMPENDQMHLKQLHERKRYKEPPARIGVTLEDAGKVGIGMWWAVLIVLVLSQTLHLLGL